MSKSLVTRSVSEERSSTRAAFAYASGYVAAIFIFSATTFAQDHFAEPEAAVEGGREALDRWNDYEWYDDEADDVRRIEVKPPPQPRNWNWNRNWDWQLFASLLQWLAWSALAVILALILFYSIRKFLDREVGDAQFNIADKTGMAEVDRLEALPFKINRPESDLLGAAHAAYRRGDFNEAIVYLYSHMLVQFDQAHIIQLARGKTNRRYLREAARRDGARPLLEPTMIAFEDAFFGDHRLTRARFESCWTRLRDLDTLVGQASQPA